MNLMFLLYLIIGVSVYGVIEWKLALGKKAFSRFNFQNRMWGWAVAIGGTVILSVINVALV